MGRRACCARPPLLTTVNSTKRCCVYTQAMNTNALTRYVLMGCGWLALALGAVGLVLPVLPTAPFVLVAAACFMRSSERLHAWVVEHPTFGIHIRDYLAGKGLRRRTKVLALATLWASVSVSVAVFVPLFAADAAIVVIAALVTVYILRLPTCDAGGSPPDSD